MSTHGLGKDGWPSDDTVIAARDREIAMLRKALEEEREWHHRHTQMTEYPHTMQMLIQHAARRSRINSLLKGGKDEQQA